MNEKLVSYFYNLTQDKGIRDLNLHNKVNMATLSLKIMGIKVAQFLFFLLPTIRDYCTRKKMFW
jgi:hypothetical protein